MAHNEIFLATRPLGLFRLVLTAHNVVTLVLLFGDGRRHNTRKLVENKENGPKRCIGVVHEARASKILPVFGDSKK